MRVALDGSSPRHASSKLVPRFGASTYLAPAGFAVYKPEQYMLSIILSLYTLALPWEVERVLL